MSHGVPRGSGERPATLQDRERETKRISDYQGLVDSVNARVEEHQYSVETLALTSKLLIRNPEYYTIWNYRRLILQYLLSKESEQFHDCVPTDRSITTRIADDLAFLLPLLRKFPKCYWIWNYRLWLLREATKYLPATEARGFWQQELMLAGKMLSLDSRNFLGWGYRRTIITALESNELSSDDSTSSMVEQEFEYTTKMINSNLSNFSAWHNRSKIIPKLLNERQADHKIRRKFLDEELELIQRALWTDSDDQSLWFYHQFLMCTFDPKYTTSSMVPQLTEGERSNYLFQELHRVQEMLDGAEDCKWVYQSLIDLSVLSRKITQHPYAPFEASTIWIDKLLELDPLRRGRWEELKKTLQQK